MHHLSNNHQMYLAEVPFKECVGVEEIETLTQTILTFYYTQIGRCLKITPH